MVSHLIQWDHSVTWRVPRASDYISDKGMASTSFKLDLSPGGAEEYLLDHVLDSKVLMPASGYICLAWKALGKLLGRPFETLSVVFENIRLNIATLLDQQS